MDIFGMIKKLGEGVGQAVATGASQAGRAVGVKPAGKSAGAKPAGRPVATPAGRSVPGVQPIGASAGAYPIGASAGAYPAGRSVGFEGIGAQVAPQTNFLDLYNEMQPGGGLGQVQNPYELNQSDLPIYTRRRR